MMRNKMHKYLGVLIAFAVLFSGVCFSDDVGVVTVYASEAQEENSSASLAVSEDGSFAVNVPSETVSSSDSTSSESGSSSENTGAEENGSEDTGSEATGSEATGSEATGSEATGSEATGSEATGSEATGSEDTGSEGTGSEGTVSEGTGSEGTGSEDTGSEGTGSEDTGSEGTGSEETVSEGTGSEGTGSEGTGSEGTGSEDTGSEGTGSEDTGSEDTSSEDIGSENTSSEDSGSEDTVSEGTDSEDTGSEDVGSEGTVSEDAGSEDTVSEGTGSEGIGSEDTGFEGTETEETVTEGTVSDTETTDTETTDTETTDTETTDIETTDTETTDTETTGTETTDTETTDTETTDTETTDTETTDTENTDTENTNIENTETGDAAAGTDESAGVYSAKNTSGGENGEGGEAATEEVPEDNGEVETEEEYAVPAGSATLKINGTTIATTYQNDTSNNAIVNALAGAINHLYENIAPDDSESGTAVNIEIIVSEGVYENGVDLSYSNEYEKDAEGNIITDQNGLPVKKESLHDKLKTAIYKYLKRTDEDEGSDTADVVNTVVFGGSLSDSMSAPYGSISIVAQDAYDEDGNVTANGSGKAEITGSVMADGFNLLLAGIYLATENKVSVNNAESLEYYGTQLGDNASISTEDVWEVAVDTGDGDDTVDLEVTKHASVSIGWEQGEIADDGSYSDGGSVAEKIEAGIDGVVDLAAAVAGGVIEGDSASEMMNKVVASVKDEIDTAVSQVTNPRTTKVDVKTGKGNDKANVKINNGSDFNIDTGSLIGIKPGDTAGETVSETLKQIDLRTGNLIPTFSLDVDLGKAELNVDLGDGADELNISGGMELDNGRAIMRGVSEYIQVRLQEDAREKLNSVYTIDGGKGDDAITIDTTSAFSSLFGLDVNVEEAVNAGFDHVHITGKLAEDEYALGLDSILDEVNGHPIFEIITRDLPYADRIVRTDSGVSIKAMAEMSIIPILSGMNVDLLTLPLYSDLNVNFNHVEVLSDLLENKETVTIEGIKDENGAFSASINAKPFTNYLITDYSYDEEYLMDGDQLILDDQGNPIVISRKPCVDYKITVNLDGEGLGNFMSNVVLDNAPEKLVVENLEADGLNVILTAPEIVVNGSITGENVLLLAESHDKKLLDATVEKMDDLAVAETDDNGNEVSTSYGASVGQIVEEAKITLGANSSIRANGLVTLETSTRQTENLISVDVGKEDVLPNFIVVKVGRSEIDLQGAITAGGSVKADAQSYTSFKADDLLALIPLAFAWNDVNTKVTMGGSASIESGAGTMLRTDSQVYGRVVDDGSFIKIDLSLAGVGSTADTKTTMEDQASITAGGDVSLTARNRTTTEAVSLAVPTDMLAYEKKVLGVFAAANFALSETEVKISENASIAAMEAVRAEADGLLRTATYAIASPISPDAGDASGGTQEATQTKKATSVVSLVEQILVGTPKRTDSLISKIAGGVTGSNSLGQKFDSANADHTQDALPSSVQAVGAIALSYTHNTVGATIDTSRFVTSANGAITLASQADTTNTVRADGSLYNNSTIAFIPGYGRVERTASPSNAAAGAGIAISGMTHLNSAEIKNGTVQALTGLDVSAKATRTESSVVAKAGHIPSTDKLGLGGAIAVHTMVASNDAKLRKDAQYILGDKADLSVVSTINKGISETIGDASGKRVRLSINVPLLSIPLENPQTYSNSSVGVGAGLAIGVTGIDVTAEIEDGVQFHSLNESGEIELPEVKSLGSLHVEASYKGTENVLGAAGAAGGISVTPVAATGITGVSAEAILGESTQGLKIADDAVVKASSQAVRTLTADASAAGSRVGIGAAAAVAVVLDSADAEVRRTINADGDITVNANSVSRMTESVKAATQGAPSDTGSSTSSGSSSGNPESTSKEDKDSAMNGLKGDSGKTEGVNENSGKTADETADKKIESGKNLAEKGGVSTKNVNQTSIQNSSDKRQKFATSEGSVQVAAAMAVNVQTNKATAMIIDGVDIIAVGDVTILSRNDTDATVKADASTANSTYGVGVAAAVNTVIHDNIARMGSGRLQGRNVTVAAEHYNRKEKDKLDASMQALVDYISRNVDYERLVEVLSKAEYENSTEYRFNQILAHEVDTSRLTAEELAAYQKIISDMLDIALWQVDLEEDERVEYQGVIVEGGGQMTLRDKINKLLVASNLHPNYVYEAEDYILAKLAYEYLGVGEIPETKYSAQYDQLIGELKTVMEYTAGQAAEYGEVQKLVFQLANGQVSNDELSAEEKNLLNKYLKVATTDNEGNALKETDIAADRLERAKAAKKILVNEVAEILTGEGGADETAELFAESLADMTEDIFESFTDAKNWDSYLGMVFEAEAELAQLIMGADLMYTNVVNMLVDRFGVQEELTGIGHSISTKAISGVGASNVGVAGSAAITVVVGTSEATIVGAENTVNAEETLNVSATEVQKIYTEASASSDKKLNYMAKAQTAQNPGSSVGVGAAFALNTIEENVNALIGVNRILNAGALEVTATLRDDIDTLSTAGSDPLARRAEANEIIPTLGYGAQSDKNIAMAQAAALGTNTKGVSADASLAISIVNNDVSAVIENGGSITTTGGDTIETLIQNDEESFKKANVIVQASITGDSYTAGSAFAAGSKAAIGATVAASIVQSDLLAALRSDTNAAGSVRIYAGTANTDEVNVLATSVGASLDRMLEKFRYGLQFVSIGTAPTTALSTTLVNKLNGLGVGKLNGMVSTGTNKLGNASPFSANLLKAFNVDFNSEVAGSQNAVNNANTSANAANGTQSSGQATQNGSSNSLNIAAAIGVAYTNHEAVAELSANVVSGGEVEVKAENRANFRNRASAATISLTAANTVGTAAAITVNDNTAKAQVNGNVNAEEDVLAQAQTTQNMDGYYPGYLTAQAVAASIAGGTGASFGAAGAVAVAVDWADTIAEIAENVKIIAGGDMSVKATDLSKIGVRALGFNAGTQKVGVGASFALVYADSDIRASIGDNASVTANSLEVIADREVMDASKYVFPFDWDYLFTMQTRDQNVEDSKKGLLHISLPNDIKNIGQIQIDVTFGSDNVADMLDMLNYLAAVNYYVEAISGSIVASGDATAAVAGTVAALHASNDVDASIGENVSLILLGKNENGESLRVKASSDATSRVISGAVSASGAKVGVGANITVADIRDSAIAEIDNGTKVYIDQQKAVKGDVTVESSVNHSVWDIAIADTISAGASSAASLGGTVNVLVTGLESEARVGDNTVILTEGNLDVEAVNYSEHVMISMGINLAANATVAAGGTVAVAVSDNKTRALVGDNASITANSVDVNADSSDLFVNMIASISGAAQSTVNVAGTLGVGINNSLTEARVGAGAAVTACNGAINVKADNRSDLVTFVTGVGITGSGTVGAGASVHTQIFNQKVLAAVGISQDESKAQSAALIANGGSAVINATAENLAIAISAAGSVSGSATVSLAGAILTNVSRTEATAELGDAVTVKADDSIGILADVDSTIVSGAGSMSATGGTAGVGASINTLVVENIVQALAGDKTDLLARCGENPTVTTVAAGITIPNREERRKGIVFSALNNSDIYMASVSGAGAGTAGVSGVIATSVYGGAVRSGFGSGGRAVATGSSDVYVSAENDALLVNFAGALSAAGTAGVGATVVTQVFDTETSASIGEDGDVDAEGDIELNAESKENLVVVAVTFAAGGTAGVGASGSTLVFDNTVSAGKGKGGSINGASVQVNAQDDSLAVLTSMTASGAGTAAVSVGANALVFQNEVDAYLGGSVIADGDIGVHAAGSSDLINVAAAVAGSGTAAVTPVAVVTYYEGSNEALVLEDAVLKAGGKLSVTADSKEFITADVAGAAGSGTASVSGAVDIVISKQNTKAEAGKYASLEGSSIDVTANNDFDFVGAAGVVAASGVAAVGVTAVVAVMNDTTSASIIGGDAAHQAIISAASGAVNVHADNQRDAQMYAANISGSGAASVSATIMVLVSGGKLTQDAADSLIMDGDNRPDKVLTEEEYKNLSEEEKAAYDASAKGGFDPDKFLDDAFSRDGVEAYRKDSLAADLEGDGIRQSESTVGSSKVNADGETEHGFDGESGYRSDDFDRIDSDTFGDDSETNDKNPGENAEINPESNSDIAAAGQLGSEMPGYTEQAAKDATTAFIGSYAEVNANTDIHVIAYDNVQADIITATVSAGAYAGVGAGIAVAVMFSNVDAHVSDNTVLNAGGDIEIIARTGSVEQNVAADEENRVLVEQHLSGSEGVDLSKRTIRAISVTAGGAFVGVSVAVASVNVFSTAQAYLAGDVTGASSLTVKALNEFPNTLAVTVSVAGGVVGVGASVAQVASKADVASSIKGDASIRNVGNVNVLSELKSNAVTGAGAIAGGAVAVNGAISLAVNLTRVDTFVGQGVSMENVGSLNVQSNVLNADAHTYIISAQVGAVP